MLLSILMDNIHISVKSERFHCHSTLRSLINGYRISANSFPPSIVFAATYEVKNFHIFHFQKRNSFRGNTVGSNKRVGYKHKERNRYLHRQTNSYNSNEDFFFLKKNKRACPFIREVRVCYYHTDPLCEKHAKTPQNDSNLTQPSFTTRWGLSLKVIWVKLTGAFSL